MTKQDLLDKTATIVVALGETGGSPESTLYIFLGMDMDQWQTVRHILVKTKIIQIQSNYVTLTDEGQRIADKLNQRLNKKGLQSI